MGERFPTSQDYEIKSDLRLDQASMRPFFERAVRGQSLDVEELFGVLKKAVGRETLTLNLNGNTENGYKVVSQELGDLNYSFVDRLSLNPSQSLEKDLARLMRVTPENLTTKIPEGLTPELLTYIFAIHEAEHATQPNFLNLKVNSDGVIDLKTLQYNTHKSDHDFSTGNTKFSDLTVFEADADYTIGKHLKEMDRPEIAQFWQDTRVLSSMVNQYASHCDSSSFVHDVSGILQYFDETGSVLDVDRFIEEKKGLIEKIYQVDGFHLTSILNTVASDYSKIHDIMKDENQVTKFQDRVFIKPQGLRFALETLLDEGKLEGVQKWQAEQFVASMDRLGYEADPNYSFEAQLRDVLEKDFGLSRRVDAAGIVVSPLTEADISASPPAASALNLIKPH